MFDMDFRLSFLFPFLPKIYKLNLIIEFCRKMTEEKKEMKSLGLNEDED